MSPIGGCTKTPPCRFPAPPPSALKSQPKHWGTAWVGKVNTGHRPGAPVEPNLSHLPGILPIVFVHVAAQVLDEGCNTKNFPLLHRIRGANEAQGGLALPR